MNKKLALFLCVSLATLAASATDNVGVTQPTSQTSGTYQFAWDSTTVPNGPAILTAVAFDAAGNSTTSAPITVNVLNCSLHGKSGKCK